MECVVVPLQTEICAGLSFSNSYNSLFVMAFWSDGMDFFFSRKTILFILIWFGFISFHSISSDSFVSRTLCDCDVQLTENLLAVVQCVVADRPDMCPILLRSLLRLLETGAATLAKNAKYGRFVLHIVKSYKKQVKCCFWLSWKMWACVFVSVCSRPWHVCYCSNKSQTWYGHSHLWHFTSRYHCSWLLTFI